MAKHKKQPKHLERPEQHKAPRSKAAPDGIKKVIPTSVARLHKNDPIFKGGVLCWRLSHRDRNGQFAWPEDTAAFSEIVTKLSEFEQQSSQNLKASGCHEIELDSLSDPAKKRLQELKLDDLDILMSWRLTSRKRVFSIPDGAIQRLLWWDPEHAVCPSNKRHT